MLRSNNQRFPQIATNLHKSLQPPSLIRRCKSTTIGAPQYCLEIVQKNDYENFLCTLLLSTKERRSALAVRAFNVEVARVASVVTEDAISLMRLKFWDDSLNKLFTKDCPVPEHPVLQELKLAIDSYKIPKRHLSRLITSRSKSARLNFNTIKDVETYADDTCSTIFYCLLQVGDVKNVDADHAASHLGKAQGIVNLLRATPHQNRGKGVCIPLEILIKHGVSQERILRNEKNDKDVQECVFELAGVANSHLVKAQSLCEKVPKVARKMFLPAVAVNRYLERLRLEDFYLSSPRLQQRDATLPLAYYWNSFRAKY